MNKVVQVNQSLLSLRAAKPRGNLNVFEHYKLYVSAILLACLSLSSIAYGNSSAAQEAWLSATASARQGAQILKDQAAQQQQQAQQIQAQQQELMQKTLETIAQQQKALLMNANQGTSNTGGGGFQVSPRKAPTTKNPWLEKNPWGNTTKNPFAGKKYSPDAGSSGSTDKTQPKESASSSIYVSPDASKQKQQSPEAINIFK